MNSEPQLFSPAPAMAGICSKFSRRISLRSRGYSVFFISAFEFPFLVFFFILNHCFRLRFLDCIFDRVTVLRNDDGLIVASCTQLKCCYSLNRQFSFPALSFHFLGNRSKFASLLFVKMKKGCSLDSVHWNLCR